MPVFVALSAGLFAGLLLGTGAIAGGTTAGTVIFLIVAGMLGISISRMVMRLSDAARESSSRNRDAVDLPELRAVA